jgi:cation diffusion facilitator CzcD-associated flavoprotein CzcO
MNQTTVVIGAGPYGLTVAAHLRHRGVPTVVLGPQMAFWHGMPAGMFLKSSWSASSLSDPAGAFRLDNYVADAGIMAPQPIPLALFNDYCAWFQRNAVGPVDEACVTSLHRNAAGFEVELTDGRVVDAGRVVVATGIGQFAHLPAFADGLPPQRVTHTLAVNDPDRWRGATVAVVGAGQSALESAALLHEAGASVEVIARGPILWVSRRLYRLHPVFRHLLYAPSDVGPAGVSRVVDRQLLVHRLPTAARRSLTRRSVRPAGATWLKPRVDGVVRLTPHTAVLEATASQRGVRLRLGDGSTRELDHLVLGTGYRARVDRLDFFSPELRDSLETVNGLPRLNRWFESSVPRLHFVGALAEHNFGALCRFVAGAGAAGRQVSARAGASLRR